MDGPHTRVINFPLFHKSSRDPVTRAHDNDILTRMNSVIDTIIGAKQFVYVRPAGATTPPPPPLCPITHLSVCDDDQREHGHASVADIG